MTAEVLKLTPFESLAIRESAPEALVVEAEYGPGGKPPPGHYHPAQEERFEILSGRLTARVDGEERLLGPGEVLEIPRGTAHQMWNSSDEPALAKWRTMPRGRTEDWFRAIDALHRSGRVGSNGMPGPLAFATLLTEYRDVFRLSSGPEPVVRGALSALAVVGRRRGYGAAGTG